MKRSLRLISITTLMSLILSACNLPIIPITGPTDTANATEPPVNATEPPATLAPIDLAGPPMEVGSKYAYVDGTILVAVPQGLSIMGYDSADNPIHEVNLSGFWIYSTKVTNQQYALCMQSGKCSSPDPKNNPLFGNYRYINYPVTGVDYDQASQYCSFVHGRLPTEAEWEKVARGVNGNIFPWGDAAPTCDLLNFGSCIGKTTPINNYVNGVSFYGALDMAGNTREWVSDWYSPTYFNESPAEDPLGPEFGDKRSVRGSSYRDGIDSTFSAHRFALNPTENLPDLGFRCVVKDPVYFAPMCQQLAYVGIGPNGEGQSCKPDIKCNDVSISQAPVCTPKFVPYTIVSFKLADNPPDGWQYDVPGCSQIPGTDKFQCNPPGPFTASVVGACEGTNTCESVCPEHYVKEGGVCQWDGSGTVGKECIAGTTYDPLTQCCSAIPGSGMDFELCPAGYHPFNGSCIADPSFTEDMESLDVQFNSCKPPKDTTGEVPGCTLTCDSSYPACQTLDPATCTCVGVPYSCG